MKTQDAVEALPNTQSISHPGWLRLYFVLAAFDLLTVAASLFFNIQMIELYMKSVETNRFWIERIESFDTLRSLASKVNAPGNDVFDSLDEVKERTLFIEAKARFDEQLRVVRNELAVKATASEHQMFTPLINAVSAAMDEMTGEAGFIFSFFASNDRTKAGSRMATMDRKFSQLNSAITLLSTTAYTIQQNHFSEQVRLAKQLQKLEYLIAISIIFMLIGAMCFGLRFSRFFNSENMKKEQLIFSLKNAIDSADQANKAKNNFLTSVSHELRTPLNAIIGFSQLLGQDKNITPDVKDSVSEIERAGHHLLRLVEDILDLHAIERNQLQISLEAVSINDVLAGAFSLVTPLAQNRDIKLEPPLNMGTTGVKADSFRLRQVLVNFLSNAIKYNRAKGSVCVTCDIKGATVRLSVIDNGQGIPEDKQTRVFGAFDRLGKEGIESDGTGIGLVISKRLIEIMGGNIGFVSMHGEGSTFWIELPYALISEVPISNAAQKPAAAPQIDREMKLVLYIEDNPANVRLMQKVVAARGDSELIHTPNAEIGIELAKANRPALILMDIQLEGMSGVEALQLLKSNSITKQIPVVALTADARPKTIGQGKAEGFADYLIKPIDITVINRLMDQLLNA